MNTLLATPLVIQLAAFMAVFSGLWALGSWLSQGVDQRIGERMRQWRAGQADDPAARFRGDRQRVLEDILSRPDDTPPLAAHLLPSDERARSLLRARLMRAGCYSNHAVALFFVVRLVALVAGPLVALLCWAASDVSLDRALLFGSLGGGIGMLLPSFWIDRAITRRHRRLRAAMSDFLDLVVACVESGMTLQATTGLVADELKYTHPELAGEFAICFRQVELGQPYEVAIKDLAERTGLEELRSLSTFVQQATRFGASVGGALREMADMLRTQRELRAEEQAQKAAVKILIPTLLFIFPAVFVVLAGPAAIRIFECLGGSGTSGLNGG